MMILLCAAIAWGLTFSSLLVIQKHIGSGLGYVQRLHQVPCSKCQYFTNSNYLKCAVNPHLACSEQAIDCRDYEPLPSKAATMKSGYYKKHEYIK
jgi:hypothetical protein